MRRRREKVERHSISATDEEWRQIRQAARAAGETIRKHIVRRTLTDDPPPNARPRGSQALAPEEQRRAHDSILRLAGGMEGPAGMSWQLLLPGCIRLLCAAHARAMLAAGRTDELSLQLRQAFGQDGPEVLAALLAADGQEDG